MRAVALASLALAVLGVSDAAAQDVLVLDGHRVRVRHDRFLPAAGLPRVPPSAARPRPERPRARAAAKRTVTGELRRMLDAGAITEGDYRARRGTWDAARRSLKRLSGTRRSELGAVLANAAEIAADGRLSVSRLPAVFLTLERNREWWTTGPLLRYGQRVEFPGSELVWQYYPGQGIELQMLGNFGKANALWASRRHDDELRALLDELVPLAADRAGGLAWEYYFHWQGGSPPWTSGISQGTAIQALARAAIRLQKPDLFEVARRGLAIFRTAPPAGIRVRTGVGAHYLIYSFARHYRVANAFAQALVGLYDFAALANDDPARRLFEDGDAEARRELPHYDTGAWSYYSIGRESDLGYHDLLRGFLANLCKRTGEEPYCSLARRFGEYLHEAPAVTFVTQRARSGRPGALRFRLSKISRVGITVSRGTRTVFATSATVGHGLRAFSWRAPSRAGDYAVTIAATDLAGNRTRETATVRVLRAKRKKRHRG